MRAEAPQPAHHRRLQRLPPRRRACAQGDARHRRDDDAAQRSDHLPRHHRRATAAASSSSSRRSLPPAPIHRRRRRGPARAGADQPLDNAISFSPEGGPVTLRARASGPFGRDPGRGRRTRHPRPTGSSIIFDRFYSDRPATDASRGKNSRARLEHLARDRHALTAARSSPTTATRAEPAARRASRSAPAFVVRPPVRRRDTARRGPGWPTQLRTVHGTAVALGGHAALIRGASGSGKSDLGAALPRDGPDRARPCPAALVADDRVDLRRSGDRIVAEAPADDPRQARGARTWDC